MKKWPSLIRDAVQKLRAVEVNGVGSGDQWYGVGRDTRLRTRPRH